MYNECSVVLRAVGSLLERANRGVASKGVPQVDVLSIESQTSFLKGVLGWLKAGRTYANDIGIARSAIQSGYMLKKFRYGGDPVARSAAAIKGFIARDASLSNPSPDPYLKTLIQQKMAELLNAALPLTEVWRPKFGGGSVAEHVPWLARWERIAAYPWICQGYLVPVSMGLTLHGGESVRLCAVPKDYSKDRLITVEPWLNTFVQHATRRLAYESIHTGPLKGTAMDALYVSPETVQRSLAVEGSVNGLYATLDLSDASDSISLGDVEATFPPWLSSRLCMCRTPHFDAGDGQLRELKMFAGMGNATTFVVETLYFWAACMAIARLSGHRRAFVSVHGDDIVCDNRTVELILETKGFEALGLKLNADKSYWGQSSFRESCGIWALTGKDVTPSRFDGFDLGELSGRVGFCDVIRRMLNSGCGMQIMLADRLLKRSNGMKVSPWNVPGSELVHDKYELWTDRYCTQKTRLNKDLQNLEVKVSIPYQETMEVPADRVGYLYGALLGCVSTKVRRAGLSAEEGPAWPLQRKIRDHVVHIPVPAGMAEKKRWVPIEGFPKGVSSRIR